MMRLCNQQHRFYAGIDIHARTLSLCVLDAAGAVVARATFGASPQAVRDALAPFRDGLVVACECMFAWYWLADLCQEEKIPFVLGHALYMNAIHGGKAKNDAIDAEKIARLLRGGNLAVGPLKLGTPFTRESVADVLNDHGPAPFAAEQVVRRNHAAHR